MYFGVVEDLIEQAEWRLERVARSIEDGATNLDAARSYVGLGGDAQHAALMSEFWRAAAIEPQIRGTVERYVEVRAGTLSRAAVERGLSPAAALDVAESVGVHRCGTVCTRRVDDAAQSMLSSTLVPARSRTRQKRAFRPAFALGLPQFTR